MGLIPVDLRDMASFGAQDHELLYPAGQQFRLVDFNGPVSRQSFATEHKLHEVFEPRKHKGQDLYIVRLTAVDVFYAFTDDCFKDRRQGDSHNAEVAERVLRDKLRREQGKCNQEGEGLCSDALGRLLQATGKLDEAEPIFRRTLKTSEDHIHTPLF